MKTIREMIELVKVSEALPLTLDAYKGLVGKKIQTIYFGYDHQDGTDEFVVGELKEVGGHQRIMREDGTDTCIFLSYDDMFCCSDADRGVFYIMAN